MQLSLTDRGRWPLLLVAVLAAASGALWWPAAREDRVVLAPARAAGASMANHLPAAEAGSPPVSAPLAVATHAPALKLVGTVAAGASSFATVLRTTDAQFLQLRIGDHVDGLAVTAIEPGRIVLAGAAQPLVIEADTTPAVTGPARLAAEGSAPAASQAQPPAWPEGHAPWDLVPPFGH